MILPCQKQLFDIPDGVTYLNCAYLSPLLNSVHEAGICGLGRKRHPWTIVRADFHNETETVRALFAGLIGARADDIAIVPATSYGHRPGGCQPADRARPEDRAAGRSAQLELPSVAGSLGTAWR